MSWWMLWLLAGMAVVYFNHRLWSYMKRRQPQCECPECRRRRGGL